MFDGETVLIHIEDEMDAERIIAEIESLERIYKLRDTRPLQAPDIAAANQRHDQSLANSPWFKLWQDFGVCCRPEPADGKYQIGT